MGEGGRREGKNYAINAEIPFYLAIHLASEQCQLWFLSIGV